MPRRQVQNSCCSDIFSTHGIVWILFNLDVLWPKIKFNEKWLRCVSGSRLYFTIGGVRTQVSKSAVHFFLCLGYLTSAINI